MPTSTERLPDIVGNLPLHSYQVHYTTLCSEVAERFAQDPSLPGVLIIDQARLVGMIPRQRFIDRIKQSSESEIYLRRAVVQALLNWVKRKPLELSENCRIYDAVQLALKRPKETFCDPIVINFVNGKKYLLDFQVLLQTQTQWFGLMQETIAQHQWHMNGVPVTVPGASSDQEAIAQVAATANYDVAHVNAQPTVIQPETSLPSAMQGDSQPGTTTEPMDARLIQMGKRLSAEGKYAFQATWDVVGSVHHNTEDLIATSKVMVKELEAIREAANLVRQVSEQTRFLGWHIRILANQLAGKELDGFSRVTVEFNQLNEQTLAVVHRMHAIANRLRHCIEDILKLAQGEAVLAQSLVQKVSQVRGILTELDDWLDQQQQQLSTPPAEPTSHSTSAPLPVPTNGRTDMKRLDRDRVMEDKYLYTLLQTTEQRLKKSKKTVLRKWSEENFSFQR